MQTGFGLPMSTEPKYPTGVWGCETPSLKLPALTPEPSHRLARQQVCGLWHRILEGLERIAEGLLNQMRDQFGE